MCEERLEGLQVFAEAGGRALRKNSCRRVGEIDRTLASAAALITEPGKAAAHGKLALSEVRPLCELSCPRAAQDRRRPKAAETSAVTAGRNLATSEALLRIARRECDEV
jgi:hypothetical protein